MRNALRILGSVAIATLTACATMMPQEPKPAPPPVQAPPPPPPPPKPVVRPAPPPPKPVEVLPAEPSPAQKALEAGIAAYERGDFQIAIKLLTPLVKDASLSLQQARDAFKALAFSECLTKRVTACRSTFEQALRVDPGFELSPAERGHPVWGPQYDRARKSVLPKK